VLQSAYSWLRKNQRETIVFADHLGGIECSAAAAINFHSETLEHELIAVGGALRLRAAIRDLPFPFRETLVLRDLENLNYEEIAQVTKASIATVMTRLAQARRRLLAAIAKGEP
jgi:RNA polymerase sigma-70 factor (ECF subfamily)